MTRQDIFDELGRFFVPIHRDGVMFLAIGGAVMLFGFLIWEPIGVLAAIATAFIGYFFRDPERVSPTRDGLVLAPADGRVIAIEPTVPPMDFGLGELPLRRISIYLSAMDVHVNRTPVPGRVVRAIYRPGVFLHAASDKASHDNEQRALIIETPAGPTLAIVQIAGFLTRRIVTDVKEGEAVSPGQRIGIIRFGSRVDVYLPEAGAILVAPGQRMVAGETVLADLQSAEAQRAVVRS